MLRRLLSFFALACIITLLLLTLVGKPTWTLSGTVGLPQPEVKDEGNTFGAGYLPEVDPNAWRDAAGKFKEPKVDSKSPYPIGKVKPAGSNYTKCLVMPKMLEDDVSWIDAELGDMLDSGSLTTAVYAMDDVTATLFPIRNKGNEVMAYLSYIIDFYEELPDVAIFMHSHRFAWHNNLILDKDASLMVRHLSPERVSRDGYMNLRCHWYPGCPEWMRPSVTEHDEFKKEQDILAVSWAELFPDEDMPTVLAQPCCAQFALSRERIRSIPRELFVWLRDWVLRTTLSDFLAGRVFEYVWQYIFTASPIHCPSMSACYCDGYGLCFGDAENFDYYFELNFHLEEAQKELERWNAKAAAVALAHAEAPDGKLTGTELLDVPKAGRDAELMDEISKLEEQMKERSDRAFELGRDPKQRAKEAGRVWKEGDGF
jgi:hypothetical protein